MFRFAGALQNWTAKRSPREREEKNAARAVLFIRFSDCGWKATLRDGEDILWSGTGLCFPDSGTASVSLPLPQAIQALTQGGFGDQVASVVLLADDPDLQLLDHRLAKLTNFEPRALKEYGVQQVGGRPVAFASVPYGASGAREVERRILGFLPEHSLETYFYGLGKFATTLIAVLPGAVPCFAQTEDGGISAWLRVHGEYSNLLIANADTGIIVVRRLPFGAFTLARAYGVEHGIALEASAAAFAARGRLPATSSVLAGEVPPEHRTGAFLALAPHLRRLHDDIAATIDYFQYERLAGRPAVLNIAFSGASVAGLDQWLGESLEMRVDLVAEDAVYLGEEGLRHPLNMLEGARSGLLRLGHQPYEFVGGRFKPIKTAQTGGAMKAGAGLSAQFATFKKLPGAAALMRFAADRQQLMQPIAAVGGLILLLLLNTSFLTGPAAAALTSVGSNYQIGIERSTAGVARRAVEAEGTPNLPQAPLWAEDLVSVAYAVVPGLTLRRVALIPEPSAPAGRVLDITGAVPADSADYLKTVADYIDGLDDDPSFRRRFGQIFFTGAGSATERGDMTFRITARMTGNPPP